MSMGEGNMYHMKYNHRLTCVKCGDVCIIAQVQYCRTVAMGGGPWNVRCGHVQNAVFATWPEVVTSEHVLSSAMYMLPCRRCLHPPVGRDTPGHNFTGTCFTQPGYAAQLEAGHALHLRMLQS